MTAGRKLLRRSLSLALSCALLLGNPAAGRADDLFGSLFGGSAATAKSPQTTDQFNFAGFKEAPAAMKLRSGGQKGEGAGEGILNFWLDIPAGHLKTGQQFDIGPWADFGYVERAMMWDTAGYISGGYTRTSRKNQRLTDHTLIVEKFDTEFGTWDKLSETRGGSGSLSFDREGYYRIVVVAKGTVFVSAPQYGVVTVVDPKNERSGNLIYFDLMGQGPVATSGGFSVDGRSKPQRDTGPGGTFQPDCGERYSVSALARQGRVQWESSGNRMVQDATPWQPYRQATFVLRDTASGKILDKQEKANNEFGDYLFNANHWRDGNYLLEIHLARQHQASGINQLPVQPSQYYIHVYNCGQGQRPDGAVETRAFEGGTPPKQEELAFDPPPFAQLDGENLIRVPQVPIPLLLDPNAPKDTPNPPVRLSDDCLDLQRQIVHRNKQLQIPCDPPVLLMEQILASPRRHGTMLADYAREWEAALRQVQAYRAPFAPLAERYKNLVSTAYQSGLVVSAADMKNYRPMNPDGSPAVLGKGLPAAMFVFEADQIALATRLRTEQKAIYSAWASARLEAARNQEAMKAVVAAANQRFADYDSALREMRVDLEKMQLRLVDLYFSGLYEHCLGSGGIRTSGDYVVRDAQGREQGNPALGLPGMALKLPDAAQKKLDAAALEVPKPLHEILPLRLKQDGAKQLVADRKLMESLVEAEYLKYYAENGTWLNWVGSRLDWLWGVGEKAADFSSQMIGTKYMGQLLSELVAGKSVGEALDAVAAQRNQDFAWVGNTAQALHDAVFVRPATEVSQQIGDTLWNVTGAVIDAPGEAVADYLHMRRDVLPELENIQDELSRLAGLANSDDPRVETQRLALMQRQLELWGKMEKGVAGMDQIIVMVAGSATVLEGVSATAAQIEKATAKLGQFLAEGRQAAQLVGSAVKNQAVLEASLKHLDEVGDAALTGNPALDAVRTSAQAGGQLDELVKAQQQLAKEASGLLDDAARRAQDRLAGLDSPKNWAPMQERIGLPSDKVAQAESLGKGSMGEVRNLGDGKVIKTFPGELGEQRLKHEVSGLQTLRESDVPHIKADGVAVSNETGKVQGIIKEKFTDAQQPLDKVIAAQGGKLSRQQQIEALEYYNEAARKGVVFADPNAGNLVREVLPDGSFRYLATEGGGVLKTDPATAKKMMDLMLTDDLGGDLKLLGKDFHGDLFVDNAGKLIGESRAQELLKYGGSSFKDANIAKNIDPDLLQAFKDPAKWNEMVAQSRRAQVLQNPNALDAATRAKLSELTRLQNEGSSILQKSVREQGAALNQAQQQLDQTLEQQATQAREAAERLRDSNRLGLPPISEYRPGSRHPLGTRRGHVGFVHHALKVA